MLKNVHPSGIMYTSKLWINGIKIELPWLSVAAVAHAQVGQGHVFYVGDSSAEDMKQETAHIIMCLCGSK